MDLVVSGQVRSGLALSNYDPLDSEHELKPSRGAAGVPTGWIVPARDNGRGSCRRADGRSARLQSTRLSTARNVGCGSGENRVHNTLTCDVY